MPIGIVSFFHVRKGFGHIKTDGYPEGIFVHFRDVKSKARILVPNELVRFELKKTAKGLQARNVKRMGERLTGSIQQYELGSGMILASNQQLYAFHHQDVAGKGFKHIRRGQLVEFSPFEQGPSLDAKEIIIVDTRPSIRQYALLPNWQRHLTHLQQIAEPEPWQIQPDTNQPTLLIHYLEETFRWAISSGNPRFLQTQPAWSCFHTGLKATSGASIYGLFFRLPPAKQTRDYLLAPDWQLKGFFESHHRALDTLTQLPLHPASALTPDRLTLDPHRRWVLDLPHIIEERQKRFPGWWQKLEKTHQIASLEASINRLKISAESLVPIPQWYQETVQFLLPIYLQAEDTPSLAMVLAPNGQTYRIQTVLPLDWAYQNARLIHKQPHNWLQQALFSPEQP